MTLDLGVAGTSYVVEALNLPPKVAKRLEALGMIRGTKVEILQIKTHGGNDCKGAGDPICVGKCEFLQIYCNKW